MISAGSVVTDDVAFANCFGCEGGLESEQRGGLFEGLQQFGKFFPARDLRLDFLVFTVFYIPAFYFSVSRTIASRKVFGVSKAYVGGN